MYYKTVFWNDYYEIWVYIHTHTHTQMNGGYLDGLIGNMVGHRFLTSMFQPSLWFFIYGDNSVHLAYNVNKMAVK